MNLDIPINHYSQSNLPEIQPNYFEGKLVNDPEFLISENSFPTITTTIEGQKITINFGYQLTETEKQNLEFYLPLQLNFIKAKTGSLPSKIFISEKFRESENFMGIDDIKFWKFRYPLFTEAEKIDLNYFSILSKKIVEQSSIFEKSGDHWLMNGLKTYPNSVHRKVLPRAKIARRSSRQFENSRFKTFENIPCIKAEAFGKIRTCLPIYFDSKFGSKNRTTVRKSEQFQRYCDQPFRNGKSVFVCSRKNGKGKI
ncbi:hypothetical protein LDL59_11370 [Kaistella anthropi]|nr:hypothetical protein [Kaistella anthropi]